MATTNATLSYSNDDGASFKSKTLWVMEISQPISLSTSKHQSRHAAFVYPRSYAPGNITVNGRCKDQRSYQELSYFIRVHQQAIVDSPVTDRFARLNIGNTSGYRRLLQLSIPSEGVLCRGWIDSFSVKNQGILVPAPEYSFEFFVVFDQMSEDIGISHQLQRVYDSDDNVWASRKEAPVDTPPHEPGERDYPEPKPIIEIPEGSPLHPR